MKELLTALLWHRSRLPLILVGAFAILLPVLAFVQYRWIGQLSEAEHERLNTHLKDSVTHFTQEFNTDTARLYVSLLPTRPNEDSLEAMPVRLESWQNNNPHSALLKNIYRSSGGERGTETLQVYDQIQQQWQDAVWPEWLAKMREKAEWRTPGGEPGPQRGFNMGRVPGQWFNDDAAVLIAPRLTINLQNLDPEGTRPRPKLEGWTIIEMSAEYLRSIYLPELAKKHFGNDYFIRIARRNNSKIVIFDSVDGHPSDFGHSDATATLYDVRPEQAVRFAQQFPATIQVFAHRDLRVRGRIQIPEEDGAVAASAGKRSAVRRKSEPG